MQVPVLIIMDANKQTMALIKIRSLWGQWKFWICTVAMWGSRLGTSAGHCLVDTDTRGRYTARGAAQTRNHFIMIGHQPSVRSAATSFISAAAWVGSQQTAAAGMLSMRTNIGAGWWMFWQCISRIDQWQWSRIWSNEDHHWLWSQWATGPMGLTLKSCHDLHNTGD